MPMSSTCRNCGGPKDIANYSDNYCLGCTTAVKEAREFATREGADAGAATRAALAQRAFSVHQNHIDPRYPVSKAQYWNPARPGEQEG